MAGSQGSKGNPAHRRASNQHKQQARARCWSTGQARKRERIKTQKEREAANRERTRNGEPTPWQSACLLRAQERARLGLREAWERSLRKKEQLPAS